jgi:hypothetical protein
MLLAVALREGSAEVIAELTAGHRIPHEWSEPPLA